MRIIENYTTDFNVFHDRYIVPLGRAALVYHAQLFPGYYAGDKDAFDQTEARGEPLPLTEMPEDFRQQVERAKRLKVPFRRLRVLPDIGFLGYDAAGIKVLKNMSQRNVLAGEDVRTVFFGEQEERLLENCPGIYADEYVRGARSGISRLSFWSVSEIRSGQAPELRAVRLMSYSAKGKLGIQLCLPPLSEDLAEYVNFWHDAFENYATPLE